MATPYNAAPASTGIASSPRRRQQAVQPPNLLTTSLGNARNAGLGIGSVVHTPVSTTSLSTPFSGVPQSPGGAMRGVSPMALRSSAGFSGTYNPQQWGPLGNGSTSSSSAGDRRQAQSSRVVALAPRPVGPDEPVASPPPPYSPRREPDPQDSLRRHIDVLSPADTVSPDSEASRYGTPVSAATTLSLDLTSQYANESSPVLRQHASPNHSPSTNLCTPSTLPPPPPLKGPSQRARGSSRYHADRLLSSLSINGKVSSTAPSVTAIDALQQNTAHVVRGASDASSSNGSVRAPGARRTASTGDIGLAGGSSRSNSDSSSPITWEPGMPLPPPPPGPPPGANRSQSLNRPIESPSQGPTPILPLRQRRPPGNGTALDPVPPTPADWREEGTSRDASVSGPRSASKGPSPLHIDTSSILHQRLSGGDHPQTTTAATPAHMRRDSATGGLFRSPAVRNRSAKGIRERRSDSRNGKGRALDESAVDPTSAIPPWDDDYKAPRPTDLILPGSQSSIAKQKMPSKLTPGSGKNMQSLDGALNSAELRISSGKAVSFASSRTTPQPESGFSQRFSASTSTPPFSPCPDAFTSVPPAANASPAIPPKSYPSPLLQRSGGATLSLVVPPSLDQRPVSHLLHTPNPNESIQVPLTPSTRAVMLSEGALLGPESPKGFAGRAIERHRLFAEREAAAANDSERLDLFVQYISGESRIRRQQYASVFEDEDVAIDDLTQGLFTQPDTVHRSQERERTQSRSDTSKRTSIASSAFEEDSSSQGDTSAPSRVQESPSSATTNSSSQHRPDSSWWNEYVPSLSPIASMSVVTGQDEMDSRGRAPSRWWEDQSHSGDAAPRDAFDVLGRSKRESKYMGVHHNLSAVYENGASSSTGKAWVPPAETNQPPGYESGEYPPEKVDWYEEDQGVPPPPQLPSTPLSAPYTPDPRRLDISRLVTLPPPYPRHHPAVNNSHPDLADVRAVVRSLNEEDEPSAVKKTYESQILGKRQRAHSWCEHQRSLHRQDIEFRIEHGEISQQQYDQAEKELERKIHKSENELTQVDFDLFQSSVLTPLHSIFSDRIKLATSSLEKLSTRLFSDAQSHSLNLPQEEGDEQPELLEKLTQLKWLFEARESLHRQIYDLLSGRNNRYKATVLLPFKQTRDHEKHSEAEYFFTQDARDRRIAFDQAVSARAQAFLSVIEGNVTRGVEVQLSAFWDIAPSLLEVLHKIPFNLQNFEIQIPALEYEENPSYHTHPLQYLYSLLGHAEKSTYQFIESQINLLCLLHEMRSHALSAKSRIEAQGSDAGWADKMQRGEERQLTEDLKEKVGVVEGQWGEALGEELREVRERVRGWLLEHGGFDEEEG